MLPDEYKTVPLSMLDSIRKEMKDQVFELQIVDVRMIQHTEKTTKDIYWLVSLVVKAEILSILRKMMKLKDKENYNPHATVCEYKLE